MIDVIKVTLFSRNSQKEMTIKVVTLSAKERHGLQHDGRPRVGHNFFTKQTVEHDGGFFPVFTKSRQLDTVTDCWHRTHWPSNHIEDLLLAHSSEAGFLASQDEFT